MSRRGKSNRGLQRTSCATFNTFNPSGMELDGTKNKKPLPKGDTNDLNSRAAKSTSQRHVKITLPTLKLPDYKDE